jgi:UDP-N-acetylglucosamine acyltransferase
MSLISTKAVVEPGARVADDVRVGPFSHIGSQVVIESGCVIESNVTITGRTTIGEKSHIFPMAVIGTAADGDRAGACRLGKANMIREHVTIYGGPDAPTLLGDDNLIMIACQIGPGAIIGDHGILVNCTVIGAGAKLEDYVRSSAFTVVDRGVTVGEYTMIAGYAAVDQDAPPYAIVQGLPLRVRGVNTENLKRCGFGEDDIRALKDAFRQIFDDHTALAPDAAALDSLARSGCNPHVRRLIEAIAAASQRRRS